MGEPVDTSAEAIVARLQSALNRIKAQPTRRDTVGVDRYEVEIIAGALAAAQQRIAAITSVVNSHLVDLDGVANIFRANGMAESADEVDKAITELQEALKEPS